MESRWTIHALRDREKLVDQLWLSNKTRGRVKIMRISEKELNELNVRDSRNETQPLPWKENYRYRYLSNTTNSSLITHAFYVSTTIFLHLLSTLSFSPTYSYSHHMPLMSVTAYDMHYTAMILPILKICYFVNSKWWYDFFFFLCF